MSKVYFTSLEGEFSQALAALFAQKGDEVVCEAQPGVEYFIDPTDAYIPGDDQSVGEGINGEAAVLAYRKNVCEPLAKLESVLPYMVGKKRICFMNSAKASINWSAETRAFGHNMSKAALNQILALSKNGLIERGYTFRLFDPMQGAVAAEKAAGSAYTYFLHDRFDDGPDNKFRQDERNLVVRDALGREIPW